MPRRVSCRTLPFIIVAVAVLWACPVAADVTSVRSGHWSKPATWSGARVPDELDHVTVSSGHEVIFDPALARVEGVTIEPGGLLRFDADGGSNTLETDANVVVRGKLEMRPASPGKVHTLRFVDIDEKWLVGLSMEVLKTDVGLWVMGAGVLDIEGARKTGWTRLAGSASAGDTSITLQAAPTGWRVGDLISIAPTEHWNAGERSWTGFEERTITAINGARVALSAPLAHHHPSAVGLRGTYTAEVMNLSRNVLIEGTGENLAEPQNPGRAHILIRSTRPQSIQYATLAHMGPRKAGEVHRNQRNSRYPLHFHHSGDGSRESVVRGTVVTQSGSHAYVPHESNGITFEDTIAYDVFEEGYWWDEGDVSHDIKWRHAIHAKSDSVDQQRVSGFLIGHGEGNEITDSVTVGVLGGAQASGYEWEGGAKRSPPWVFERNIAHNNRANGIFIWQNCPYEGCHIHTIEDFVAYHNDGVGRKGTGAGIFHGAYVNSYRFSRLDLFGNEEWSLNLHAKARHKGTSGQLRPDGYTNAHEDWDSTEPIRIAKHASAANIPTLIKDCSVPGVVVGEGDNNRGWFDFVNCGLEPADFKIESMHPDSIIRVQRPDGTAYQIHEDGRASTIPAFYPLAADSAPPRPVEDGPTAADEESSPSPPEDQAMTEVVQAHGHSNGAASAPSSPQGQATTVVAQAHGHSHEVASALPSPQGQAVTLVPQADVHLLESAPDDERGAAEEMSVEGGGGGESQALLWFDLSWVPEGSRVAGATLTVETTNRGDGAAFHKMLAPWCECATWHSIGGGISADGVQAASMPDFATPSGRLSGTVSLDVTAAVQAWVDGQPNHGWALLPRGSDGWDFYSREGAVPPKLAVAFE